MTYGDLWQSVQQVAKGLYASGIRRGDHVAVCMENSGVKERNVPVGHCPLCGPLRGRWSQQPRADGNQQQHADI